MNFLKAIEGKHGETLTSAVLKFILIHSPRVRHHFAQWLAPHFPPGEGPTFDSGLFCELERPIGGAASAINKGFVDIVVESERHLLFIENKLNACFQDAQLSRYHSALKQAAESQTKKTLLAVLHPGLRDQEVRAEIAKDNLPKGCIGTLHWEDVNKWLDASSNEETIEVAAACKFLASYVRAAICDNEAPIRSEFLEGTVKSPNQWQKDFLTRLIRSFANFGSPGSGPKHTGFSFAFVPEKGRPYDFGWIGFTMDRRDEKSKFILQVPDELGTKIDELGLPERCIKKIGKQNGKRNRSEYQMILSGYQTLMVWQREVEGLLKVLNASLPHAESREGQQAVNEAA